MEKYTINEELAKRAWENIHFSDYVIGSQTAAWKKQVEKAKEAIFGSNMSEEEKNYQLDRYMKKTSEWYNSKNSKDANHVSWMISGPANYNMKKHNKWSSSMDKLYSEYDYIFDVNNYIKYKRNEIKQDIEDKIYNYGNIEVWHNTEANRLQLYFDGKPEPETITLLKKNAFKWSPRNGCWQRQLTKNALYAFEQLKKYL